MANPIFTAPNARAMAEAIDTINESLLKVQAMMAMAYGNSGEAFRSMAGEYQDTFLWAASDLVDTAKAALDRLVNEAGKATEHATKKESA